MYNTGEHNPPGFPYGNAVFHAYYGESEGVFDLAGELLEGDLPTRQQRLVAAWTEIHREELLANWKLACERQPLYKIEPLR